MKHIHTLAILLLATIFVACRQPKELVYKDIRNVKVQPGLQKSTIALDIQLYNPNHYKMRLKKAEVDVLVHGTHVGHLRLNGRFTVPEADTFSLPVILDIDMKGMFSNILQMALEKNAPVKLTGIIKASRHGIGITVPIDYETQQNYLFGD